MTDSRLNHQIRETQRLQDVATAAELLRAGKLVAFATETVYGLGANALDPSAVAGIFAAKERPFFDPLIVHLADQAQVNELVSEIPDVARKLMARFWPGPLTLVLPKRDVVPDLVTAGLPNVAIRVPQHPQTLELLRAAALPIAAPSANRFGCVSPTTAEHVLDGLSGRIDAVLDGGDCTIGVESTVLACLPNNPVTLLRPGGLPLEAIEAEIGPVARHSVESESDATPQTAPGLLSRHYAPSKPLQIVYDLSTVSDRTKLGLLSCGTSDVSGFAMVENLSPSGNLLEAATQFFAALRRLEQAEITSIIATPFSDSGLGLALNDRLRRAAYKDSGS